jgi:hypothetical protein
MVLDRLAQLAHRYLEGGPAIRRTVVQVGFADPRSMTLYAVTVKPAA